MTEEVTDAMIEAGLAVFKIGPTGWSATDAATVTDIYDQMRSASNSPTTNGEVSEPRQTHCADPDCTGPKPHVAEAAGCKWGNPRGASDDAVGRIIEDLSDLKIAAPVLGFMGMGRRSRLIHEIHELANEAAAALAALSTPTTASAVDDPETAKGGARGPAPAPNEAAWPAGFISIDALMDKVLTANDLARLSCNCCQTPHLKDCWIAALTNHSDLTEGKK